MHRLKAHDVKSSPSEWGDNADRPVVVELLTKHHGSYVAPETLMMWIVLDIQVLKCIR